LAWLYTPVSPECTVNVWWPRFNVTPASSVKAVPTNAEQSRSPVKVVDTVNVAPHAGFAFPITCGGSFGGAGRFAPADPANTNPAATAAPTRTDNNVRDLSNTTPLLEGLPTRLYGPMRASTTV
jgi:hypothetical protein